VETVGTVVGWDARPRSTVLLDRRSRASQRLERAGSAARLDIAVQVGMFRRFRVVGPWQLGDLMPVEARRAHSDACQPADRGVTGTSHAVRAHAVFVKPLDKGSTAR
jgi:hypothetical protein